MKCYQNSDFMANYSDSTLYNNFIKILNSDKSFPIYVIQFSQSYINGNSEFRKLLKISAIKILAKYADAKIYSESD